MPLQTGEQVGLYKIVEQIGAGGAAVVYKAHDPLLDRFVAVKHLADAGADRNALRQEAVTHKALTIDKPDLLVQLIDVVEDERGLMLISEYVEGESLEQRLTRKVGPMSEPHAVRIMVQLAGALYFIHKRGMVHRDVKPANVLLSETDRVKLADFGLTVALADQRAMDAGTVRYMAPEVLRGEPAEPRSDLYSLGMIAYEMLAGRQMFDEAFAPVLRDRRNAAMRWVKWHTNPRVTAPPLADLNRHVNPSLAELVERLMDKDPQRRVEDANQLVRAIQRIHKPAKPTGASADDAEPMTIPVSPGGDTAPVPKANRTKTIAAAAVGVMLLAAVVFGGYHWWQKRVEAQARHAAYVAKMDDARAALEAREFADAEAQYDRILETHPDDTIAQRNRRIARGYLALNAKRYDEAISNFEAALTIDSTQSSELTELISEAKQRQAFAAAVAQIEAHVEADAFDEAQKIIRQWEPLAQDDAEKEQLATLARTVADRRVRAAAEATMARARELADQGLLDEAIELLEPAVSQYSSDRALSEYRDQLVTLREYEKHMTAARVAEAAGESEAALASYRLAAELRPSAELSTTINKLESQSLLVEGLAKMRAGEVAEAERLLILALGKDEDNERAREALRAMKSVNQAKGFLDAGEAAMLQEDYDAAVRHYESAAKIVSDQWIKDRLAAARFAKLLRDANTAMAAGEMDRAAELLAEARRLDPEAEVLTHAESTLATHRAYREQLQLGDAARQRSDFAAAKASYKKAQAVMDTEEVRNRFDDVEYAQSIAQAQTFIDREEYSSALAMLRIALQLRDTEQVRTMIDEVQQYVE